MKNIFKFIGFLLLSIFFSCSEDKEGPLENNGEIPQQIRVTKVENLPGSARVFYSLPDDPNILYVRGEYSLTNGQRKSVKASTYTNFIDIEGFSKSEEYTVDIFTVSRSEVQSAPTQVKIKPLLARIHEIFETLNVSETFGGVYTEFKNESKTELILHTLIKDDEGKWIGYDRLYSNAVERTYSIRGLESKPTEFAFYFSDKWNNSSDTLKTTLTPLYEEIADKTLWKNAKLFNDSHIPQNTAWRLENLWDNIAGSIFWGSEKAEDDIRIPNWFTIDLGRRYIFSRIRVNQVSYHNDFIFSMGAPLYFEIWGSNNPTQDGEWGNWTKLGTFESKKPSGLPLSQLTDEDIRVSKAGEDFDFSASLTAYRYLRFKTNRTYGGTLYVAMSELTLWGQKVD